MAHPTNACAPAGTAGSGDACMRVRLGSRAAAPAHRRDGETIVDCSARRVGLAEHAQEGRLAVKGRLAAGFRAYCRPSCRCCSTVWQKAVSLGACRRSRRAFRKRRKRTRRRCVATPRGHCLQGSQYALPMRYVPCCVVCRSAKYAAAQQPCPASSRTIVFFVDFFGRGRTFGLLVIS